MALDCEGRRKNSNSGRVNPIAATFVDYNIPLGSLGTRGEYMFHVSSPKFQPYAGAGLGVHFLSAKVTVPGFPDATASSTKLGLDMGGGFITPLSPKTDLSVDLWYGIVQDFSQVSFKVGVSFDLPNGAESRAPSRPAPRHRPRRS